MIQFILALLPLTTLGFWFWMFSDMTKNDNLPPCFLTVTNGKNPKTFLEFKGLNLDNPQYAQEYGTRSDLEFLGYLHFGTTWIARNSGGSVEAEELGLLYRDNKSWRDVNELEHTMRALDEKNWPAWVYLHPQYQQVKQRL